MRNATALLFLFLGGACAQEIDLPLRLPLADAGDDQTRLMLPGGLLIGLDARASCDPEGEAIQHFLWTLHSTPPGSQALISHGDRVHASFVADVLGRYVIELRVRASERGSAPDEVVIELRDDLGVDHSPVAPERDRCGDPLL